MIAYFKDTAAIAQIVRPAGNGHDQLKLVLAWVSADDVKVHQVWVVTRPRRDKQRARLMRQSMHPGFVEC